MFLERMPPWTFNAAGKAALFVADAAFLRHPSARMLVEQFACNLFPMVIGRSLDEAIRTRPSCFKPNESWGIAEKFPLKGPGPVSPAAISRWTAPKYGKNTNICSGNDRSLFLLRREEGMGQTWCSGYLAVIPSYCPTTGAECGMGLAMVRKLQINNVIQLVMDSALTGIQGCWLVCLPESFACPREEALPKEHCSESVRDGSCVFLPIR